MDVQQPYIALYAEQSERLAARAPEVMNRRRDEALQYLQHHRLGAEDDKGNRRIAFDELLDVEYRLASEVCTTLSPQEKTFCGDVPNLSTLPYRVINDQYEPATLLRERLPEGVFFGTMTEFAALYPTLAAKHYGQIAPMQSANALNTLFVHETLVLYLQRGAKTTNPLQLLHLLSADESVLVNRRLLIILEANAEAQMLLCEHALQSSQCLVTQTIEVSLAENARLSLYELEENNAETRRLATLVVDQAANSHFVHNAVSLHAGKSRNNITTRLKGEGATSMLGGVVIADKMQHIDNSLRVEHQMPHCVSSQLYKYILDDRAKGAFSGYIKVFQDAQKTEAYQTNRNLCLSTSARMNANPQLEIYADDVRCSHGLSTGQLDEQALFYLRSRGLSTEQSLFLLKNAFTADVIDGIDLEPLRERLRRLIELRLQGALSFGDGCEECNV